jgi:hypothetical protein
MASFERFCLSSEKQSNDTAKMKKERERERERSKVKMIEKRILETLSKQSWT